MTNTIKKIILPTIILSTVAFLSAFLLSLLNDVTNGPIKEYEDGKIPKALALVLPGYILETSVKQPLKASFDGKDVEYWIAVKEIEGKKVYAHGFETSIGGFEEEITSIVGVDDSGKILGLSIIKQKESPGFGSRVNEVTSKKTFLGVLIGLFKRKKADKSEKKIRPWFQQQFTGVDTTKKIKIDKTREWKPELRDELISKNEITSITGATITSNAVVKSIRQGKEILDKALLQSKEVTK